MIDWHTFTKYLLDNEMPGHLVELIDLLEQRIESRAATSAEQITYRKLNDKRAYFNSIETDYQQENMERKREAA